MWPISSLTEVGESFFHTKMERKATLAYTTSACIILTVLTISCRAQDMLTKDIHCQEYSCSTLMVIPSLKTTYPPMRDVYIKKGVPLSDDIVFTRPIIQYSSFGIDITMQLKREDCAWPYLTFLVRQPKYHLKKNLVPDIMVFEICGDYYIFENATLVQVGFSSGNIGIIDDNTSTGTGTGEDATFLGSSGISLLILTCLSARLVYVWANKGVQSVAHIKFD